MLKLNKELILMLRDRAIRNVSNSRKVNGQIERTWLQDEFDLEFAKLILITAETSQERHMREYYEVHKSKDKDSEDYDMDGGILSGTWFAD